MSESTLAKRIAQAWQSNTTTIVFADGSIVAVPAKPEGLKDEWIEPLLLCNFLCST